MNRRLVLEDIPALLGGPGPAPGSALSPPARPTALRASLVDSAHSAVNAGTWQVTLPPRFEPAANRNWCPCSTGSRSKGVLRTGCWTQMEGTERPAGSTGSPPHAQQALNSGGSLRLEDSSSGR